MYEMVRKSRTLFPKVAEKIRAKTGIDIGYKVKGIYRIANSEEEFERINKFAFGKYQLEKKHCCFFQKN
ncbi:hypothetical protein [Lysinibacillus sphaericus]|uniref:hypothetical protein n=1 Tax=Lysinibacillus sphaericus TaxID=1421 RepID=UPI003D749471